MKNDPKALCPCDSGNTYDKCCMPLHRGNPPINALALMRSRYCAYKLGLVKYILETTHPENPTAKIPATLQKKRIEEFCKNSEFLGLKILSFEDGDKESRVSFLASIRQNGRDCSLQENSLFKKVKGKWLYHSGEVSHA